MSVRPSATVWTSFIRETAMTAKFSISLNDAQHAFAKTLVESGRYPSVSAVLQQGIDFLRRQMEDEMQERAALKQLLAQRRGRKTISGAKMDAQIKQLVARKRRENALQD